MRYGEFGVGRGFGLVDYLVWFGFVFVRVC
jgi:hypothetical protein